MSSKTLERRLAEREASYRELVDDIRCDLAKHLLANTDVRLHQIAYALGYSEPGPLVRAFKRWTDEHAHAIPPQASAMTAPGWRVAADGRRRLPGGRPRHDPAGVGTVAGIDAAAQFFCSLSLAR